MLMTTFSDDAVTVPVSFEHFPESGETFLSFTSTLGNVSKEEPKPKIEEEKVEGAGAFLPGLNSTMWESQTPSAKLELYRQQRVKAVFESESLTLRQKQFTMENILNEEEDQGK